MSKSAPFKRTLASDQVPQADVIERVFDVVEHLARGVVFTGLGERDRAYYTHAARILGYVDNKNVPTSAGRALIALGDEARLARTALALEDSTCGREWLRWADKSHIFELAPETAREFLVALGISAATAKRRARTLRWWHDALSHHHPSIERPAVVPRKRYGPVALERVSVFDRGGSARVIQALAPSTALLRAATAYFTIEGYDIVASQLRNARVRLLVGSDEAAEELANVIERLHASITHGAPTPSKRKAVLLLHEELVRGTTRVVHLKTKLDRRLHAKVYCFDNNSAYVTSANMTGGGMVRNIESGSVVVDKREITALIADFERYFLEGEEIVHDLLRPLERSWVFSALARPYLVYLKSLLTLYGEVPDLSDRTTKTLADFQRMIVGAVLRALREKRGALLIAPTGTGKTVMGAYVAASLFGRGVDRVFVVCPNEVLGNMWENMFLDFGHQATVITHGRLQQKGKQTTEGVERLKRLLETTRKTDLVIVDECHAFRNPDSQGFDNLLQLLSESLDRGEARRLLLTATPISKGFEDLQTLVNLVGGEKLATISDVKDAETIVNVSLPFIVDRFGMGEKKGLRFNETTRFFGKILVRTERYQSGLEDLFEKIAEAKFRFLRESTAQLQLPGVEADAAYTNVFYRSLLLRRAESSIPAFLSTADKIIALLKAAPRKRAGGGRPQPADPDDLLLAMEEMRALAARKRDLKLTRLVALLKERAKGEKVLIFSEYKDTAYHLGDALAKLLPEQRVETITGDMTTRARMDVIRRFAPRAQGARTRKNPVDILVATDAIGEGVSLQDASVLINYDVHWTPLRIIQRVGRVDRPTAAPRDIHVFNFFPEGSLYEDLVQLWRRLTARADLCKQMSSTAPVEEQDRDLTRVQEHDLSLVRDLYRGGDFETLVREYLPTSQVLIDLSKASDAEREAAFALPVGARTAFEGHRTGTFALLRHKQSLHAAFLDADGSNQLRASPGEVSHEAILTELACEPNTPVTGLPSSQLDDRVSDVVSKWSAAAAISPDDVVVECAAVLLGKKPE